MDADPNAAAPSRPLPGSSPSSGWDPTAPAAATAVQRGLLFDFFHFAWEEKWWWIVPSLLTLAGLGVMLYAAQGNQIAPFFYALF